MCVAKRCPHVHYISALDIHVLWFSFARSEALVMESVTTVSLIVLYEEEQCADHASFSH